MAKYAAAELAAPVPAGGTKSHPALVDRRIRHTALSAARRALETAYGGDRSDGEAGNAPACPECGGRMRHAGREKPPVETVVGRVRVSMARRACDGCGTSVRPRERAMDIEGSMTPAARRMASLAGSSCCYAEADRLLTELADVNFGAKARRKRHGVERTTRSVGDDMDSRREAALSGALSVVAAGGGGEPARKPLKEGEVLCIALDGTREAKVGALWLLEPDGEAVCARWTTPCERVAQRRAFAGVESTADDAAGDSPVARRLLRELAAAGYAPDDVRVCIGDGAAWLRRLFDDWFPNAVSIIDFNAAAGGTHASEYLWAAAGARYGPGADSLIWSAVCMGNGASRGKC